jgi:hypothetical protein
MQFAPVAAPGKRLAAQACSPRHLRRRRVDYVFTMTWRT